MSRPLEHVWGLQGDPESEAVAAARQPRTHAAAVAACDALSEQGRRMWHRRAAGMLDFKDIVRTLSAKKVPFVLTGTHGISGWTGRVRATYDVDILVKGGRNHARAVKALRERYPTLEVRLFAGVTSFFVPGEKQALIDVTYPHRADLQETLATAIWVEEGSLRYRVPTLEAALANKYGAMVTPTRRLSKRGLDAADFAAMVEHSTDEGRQPIDLHQLAELGEKVWPGGGGAEILRLVEEVKQGRMPSVVPSEQLRPGPAP